MEDIYKTIQNLYLHDRVTYYSVEELIYLEVWRRMRGVIMITHRLMVLVHKVVTNKIILLEKTIQTCARMLS